MEEFGNLMSGQKERIKARNLTQRARRQSTETTEKRGGSAQVLENVEITWGLRTKNYRPCGQAWMGEKAQWVVVAVGYLCN